MRDLVWVRGKDLRVNDHPAIAAGGPDAVHVFVVDPYFFAPDRAQSMPHRMQFLLESLHGMAEALRAKGGKLWFVAGKSVEVVPRLAQSLGVDRVLAMRWSEPFGRERDERVEAALDCPLELLEGETLLAPGTLRSQAGRPYTVFTPFNKSFRKRIRVGPEQRPPKTFRPLVALPDGWREAPMPTMESVGLKANPNLQRGGEGHAKARLEAFVDGPGSRYAELRDRMDAAGTSRLSADIKFGVISPQAAWRRVMKSGLPEAEKKKFTDELIWREFNYSTMWDNPSVLTHAFKGSWATFPWRDDEEHWDAWAFGRTGYPIVDAAARELLETGYVHNRARMIAASFLTKHLRLDYKRGEAHYMRWLTDGDWAQNNMGWQWAAGSGADAQPWFRVFNPMTQGRKFDPLGVYVQRWVPELAGLDAKFIHAPWEAPPMTLQWAGIELGETYPMPIVDHKEARTDFLATAKAHVESVSAQS